MKKMLPLALALSVTANMGCYGPFSLTKKLYHWNGQVGEKWVNEGVFLGLAILPVYGFSLLGDAIIFNSIEFWTGSNPVTAKTTKIIREGDKQVVLNYSREIRRLRVDGFEKGRPVCTVVFEPNPQGGMVARDAKGGILMSARADGGTVVLKDASNREISRHDFSETELMLASRNAR